MTPLLFALYLIVYTVAAQQQPTIFSSYRLSSFAILQRSDLMAAYSIVIDPTSSEQVLYVCGEVYGGSKLIPTALRTNANAFILKMNTNGTLIWSFLLGSSTLCLDIEISQTTGELVAIVNSKITGPSYIYSIYKADGTIFWNKELNFEKSIVSLYLTEIQSSGLYVSGTINDGAGKSQVFIINLDPISGNQMWMDSFGGTGDDKAQALTSVNNQLVVMGTISSDLDGQKFSTASSTTCFIAWYGQNGTRDAKRTRLFGSPSDGCMIVTAAYDSSSDSILFTGAFTSPINVVSDKWAGFVGRLSASTGAVKYIQPFSDIIYSSIAADQVLLPDGSWLMCGQTSGQFDQTNLRYGKSDLFLMSVHPENGSILWSFTWGGAQNDACSSLQNHLDSTKKHQIIYTGGWGSSSQEQLVMFLSTFNMTALGEALPFKPIVVSPDPTGNNNTSQPSDTGTNMSPLIAGLVGSFAFIAVSAVLYILHAKQRAKKRPLGEDASNMAITDTAFHLTQIVTKTALPSQSTVNATSITKGLNANNERTMVPSFMGKLFVK
jgi:hypothetical protein